MGNTISVHDDKVKLSYNGADGIRDYPLIHIHCVLNNALPSWLEFVSLKS